MINFIKELLKKMFEKPEPKGLYASRNYNRMNGNYRVLYDDDEVSEPMCLDTAKSYANIFGGKVIPK